LKPPWLPIRFLQFMYRPARQRSQDRQGIKISTATRSPADTPQRRDVDSEISSMIPSGS
jgi:hypothetical protein